MDSASMKYIYRRQCEQNLMHLFALRRGIFYEHDIFQRILPFTMVRLTLFFIISQAFRRLLKPFKQTEFVCDLLTGIILGPCVLGRIYKKYNIITDRPNQIQFINVVAYMGVLYHVFLISIKTDFGVLKRSGKKVWVIGLSSLFASFFVMASLNDLLNPLTFKTPFLVYIFVFQHSSTWFTNLAPILEELNLLTTEMGQLALASSMTNEVVTWCFWMYLLITNLFHLRGFYNGVMPLCLVVGSIMLGLRPVLIWFIKRVPQGEPVKEVYVIGILLGAFVMSFISDIVAGSPVLGVAFLGLVIPSGPPLGKIIQQRSEMFIKICLLPFFYLAIGDMTDIYGIRDLKAHIGFQSILIIGYCIKTFVTMLVAMYYKISPRLGLALGLVMDTSGVLNVMVFLSYTLRQKMYSDKATHLVLNSLVVTTIVTPLAFYLHKDRNTNCNKSIEGFDLSFLATLEAPKLKILACIDTDDEISGIISLLNVSSPSKSHPIDVYVVHLSEFVGQATPILMVHRDHKRICDYNGCVHIMTALKSYCEKSEGGINIQLLTMITPFKSIHEGISFLAREKMIPLLIVPYNYTSQGLALNRNSSSDLNRKLQLHMPCTIGILVHRDKASKQWNYKDTFSYRVHVIYFGGEDDREALAYATRMSRHPRVSITLTRVVVKESQGTNKHDKKLDDFQLALFKTRVVGKSRAHVFQQIYVQDWLKALDVIKSFDNNYELVMVGRRHGETTVSEKELSVLCENPELGLIGEIFVCNELRWGNTSILVMQHCRNIGRDEVLDNLKVLEDNV
ncbi:cation/H(+) antiporter 15-like [Amaranthus tricolor]|uniref:cation/H(+) antiporter 15-like n=1 Tax=Amaranthus tricolor TaxID=29722 RepID=UPI002583BB6F|nr:cation/H(+) antiporter 15-like [Amaranthus tricolor]